MRMWMVDPKIMCTKHLNGEHVEIHMFIGSLKKQISMDGYVKNNLFQPLVMFARHELLKQEMMSRGFKHNSEVCEETINQLIQYLPTNILNAVVDVESSLEDLISRCPNCKDKYEKLQNIGGVLMTTTV